MTTYWLVWRDRSGEHSVAFTSLLARDRFVAARRPEPGFRVVARGNRRDFPGNRLTCPPVPRYGYVMETTTQSLADNLAALTARSAAARDDYRRPLAAAAPLVDRDVR